MPDGRQRPSFWETVPGTITAIAALIGAVAALITALYGAKLIGHDSEKAVVKSTRESAARTARAGTGDAALPSAASSKSATQQLQERHSEDSPFYS